MNSTRGFFANPNSFQSAFRNIQSSTKDLWTTMESTLESYEHRLMINEDKNMAEEGTTELQNDKIQTLKRKISSLTENLRSSVLSQREIYIELKRVKESNRLLQEQVSDLVKERAVRYKIQEEIGKLTKKRENADDLHNLNQRTQKKRKKELVVAKDDEGVQKRHLSSDSEKIYPSTESLYSTESHGIEISVDSTEDIAERGPLVADHEVNTKYSTKTIKLREQTESARKDTLDLYKRLENLAQKGRLGGTLNPDDLALKTRSKDNNDNEKKPPINLVENNVNKKQDSEVHNLTKKSYKEAVNEKLERKTLRRGYECDNDTRKVGEYKYKEVVRKKQERKKLKGYDCPQCADFIEAFLFPNGCTEEEIDRLMKCSHVSKKNKRNNGDKEKEKVKQDFLNEFSRHRHRFTPPQTPEGYWELSFLDSIEKRKKHAAEVEAETKEKEKGKENIDAKSTTTRVDLLPRLNKTNTVANNDDDNDNLTNESSENSLYNPLELEIYGLTH